MLGKHIPSFPPSTKPCRLVNERLVRQKSRNVSRKRSHRLYAMEWASPSVPPPIGFGVRCQEGGKSERTLQSQMMIIMKKDIYPKCSEKDIDVKWSLMWSHLWGKRSPRSITGRQRRKMVAQWLQNVLINWLLGAKWLERKSCEDEGKENYHSWWL